MADRTPSAASVCECGQLRVTGIYRGGAISCPVCNGTPRQPSPFATPPPRPFHEFLGEDDIAVMQMEDE